MRARPTATQEIADEAPTEITDADREHADRVLAAIDPKVRLEPIAASERIAWALAQTRAAAYTAGLEQLERAADLAHAAGYDEGRLA